MAGSALSIVIALALGLFASPSCAVYMDARVYPNETAPGTQPLYFGLMKVLSFSGFLIGSVTVPSVEVALDQINADSSVLPGYTLHYILADSACDRLVALEEFHERISTPPVMIAWIGSGCSQATEATAEISHFYNLNQISCVSSSPSLRDRERFRYYFQMLPSEDDLALGFFAIIQRYQWRRVAIIVEDTNLYTTTMEKLIEQLRSVNVLYSEQSFETTEDILLLGGDIFDDEARIFVLLMGENNARVVVCEAYKRGYKYPTHLLLTLQHPRYGSPTWWRTPGLDSCTADQRESVMDYVMGPINYDLITNYSAVTDTGITGFQFNESFSEHFVFSFLGFDSGTGAYGYDSTWTLAKALNSTLTDLLFNDTLRRMAGIEAELEDPDGFGLENFTYKNRIIAETIFRHLEKTSFTGLTGPVMFDSDGIRTGSRSTVRQVRPESSGTRLVDIAFWTGDQESTTFEYIPPWSDDTVWPDGVPEDDDSSASPSSSTVSVGMLALGALGMLLVANCMN